MSNDGNGEWVMGNEEWEIGNGNGNGNGLKVKNNISK